MVAIVEGMILEDEIEKDTRTNEMVRKVMIYQKGEKKNLIIKNVPLDSKLEKMQSILIKCKVNPWANDRKIADISCNFIAFIGGIVECNKEKKAV